MLSPISWNHMNVLNVCCALCTFVRCVSNFVEYHVSRYIIIIIIIVVVVVIIISYHFYYFLFLLLLLVITDFRSIFFPWGLSAVTSS